LAVEQAIHDAAHLFQRHLTFDVLLKNTPGLFGWFKPFHAHRGQRVFNFSSALWPRPINNAYRLLAGIH
jgi:hypothetical protein